MGFGDIHGKARVDPRKPRAFGASDFSGFVYNRKDLIRQMEWAGTSLIWTGMLVPACEADKPQPQLKAIRLPPDPVPVVNPRPLNFSTIDRPSGFTQYVMWAGGAPLNFAVVLDDGNGNPIVTNTGQEILLEVGSDGIALLAQLAQMTGIPVPGTVVSYNSTIQQQLVAQQLVPANPTRKYIAIFNPCTSPIGVSIGVATVGVPPSVTLGPGSCLFWATAQNFGQPYTGAMTVIGNFPSCSYYVYDAGA